MSTKSVHRNAKSLSKRLSGSGSKIGFRTVYRRFSGEVASWISGTQTRTYADVVTRAYATRIPLEEEPVSQGADVIGRQDVWFHLPQGAATPLGPDDLILQSIYDGGTISIDAGGTRAELTGGGPLGTLVAKGDFIAPSGEGTYIEVGSVISGGTLRLASTWTGGTVAATVHIYRQHQVIEWGQPMHLAEIRVRGRKI